jgi:hypothetical protein
VGRRAATVLAAGALLLLLSWVFLPLPSPPLYDGLEAPAEPYRYLLAGGALSGGRAPTSAHASIPVVGSTGLKSAVSTGELPPQASVYLTPLALVLPTGATAVDVSITPVLPPRPAPDGPIAGNVYRIDVTANGGPVAVRPGEEVGVVLRSPAGLGTPTIELLAGGRWTGLHILARGTVSPDLYGASLVRFGDVALVVAPAAPATGGGVGVGVLLAGGAGALLLAIAGVVVLIRVRARA